MGYGINFDVRIISERAASLQNNFTAYFECFRK